MSQYFEYEPNQKDQEIRIIFTLHNKTYTLASNTGVFSKDRLDTGTRILLETVLDNQEEPDSVLDLGCGIGPVGLVLSHEWKSKITMIDINEKATDLARKNMKAAKKAAKILHQDGIKEGIFDCILLNPPIHIGKIKMYQLFDQCLDHLNGNLWIVIRKQHGAQSAVKHFEKKGCQVERVYREKGFWILKIRQK